MIKLLAAPILILTISVYAEEASLIQGWRMVASSNHAFDASRARSEAAHEGRMAALGGYLPVVKLEASANHMDRDLVMDLDPIRSAMIELESRDQVSLATLQSGMKGVALTPAQQAGIKAQAQAGFDAALPHFQETIKDQDNWTAALVAYQPLFHGGRILAANRQAAARSHAADADTLRQLADLRRDFGKLYVQGALLQRSIALRKEALEAITRHGDRARHMVEQGMADRSAQLRADLAVSEATTALFDDSSKLATVEIALGQLAGTREDILPTDPLPDPPAAPASGNDGTVEGNPLLSALQAQRDAASGATWSRAGEFLPEVGAFGRYELHREALSVLDPNWIVGVRGTWTLFRGGTDYHAWQAARRQEVEAASMEGEARSLLDLQHRRQILSWTQARGKWVRMETQENLAKENHRVAELRFQQGQGTSLDVVDAWLSMEKASLERLSASGDAWGAALETQWSEGHVERFGELWNKGGVK